MHTSMRTHICGTHGIRSDVLSGSRAVSIIRQGGESTPAWQCRHPHTLTYLGGARQPVPPCDGRHTVGPLARCEYIVGNGRYVGQRRLPNRPFIDTYLVPDTAPQGARSGY
eukprot:124952-Prymnesium_polylepis.1